MSISRHGSGRRPADHFVSCFPPLLSLKMTAGTPAPLSLPAPPSAWIRRLAGNSWTWGEWGQVPQVSLELLGSEHHSGQICPTHHHLLTGSLSAEHPPARAGRRKVATACPWAAGERSPWHPPTHSSHSLLDTYAMLDAFSTGSL